MAAVCESRRSSSDETGSVSPGSSDPALLPGVDGWKAPSASLGRPSMSSPDKRRSPVSSEGADGDAWRPSYPPSTPGPLPIDTPAALRQRRGTSQSYSRPLSPDARSTARTKFMSFRKGVSKLGPAPPLAPRSRSHSSQQQNTLVTAAVARHDPIEVQKAEKETVRNLVKVFKKGGPFRNISFERKSRQSMSQTRVRGATLEGWDDQDPVEEEDDEADDMINTEELKEYHHMGDLPEWNQEKNSMRLVTYFAWAVFFFLPGGLIQYAGGVCAPIKGLCIGVWAVYMGVLIIALPLLQLAVLMVVTLLKNSFLIHRNEVYFVVRLHKPIASLLWSITMYCLWVYYAGNDVGNGGEFVRRIIASYLALQVLLLLKDVLVLHIANRYMWRPYLERIQHNIFAQYIILILTDYALGYSRNEKDQQYALQFAKQAGKWDKLSLYAITRAISFVPGNKLRQTLYAQEDGTFDLDTKRAARRFGHTLFDRLLEACAPVADPASDATAPRPYSTKSPAKSPAPIGTVFDLPPAPRKSTEGSTHRPPAGSDCHPIPEEGESSHDVMELSDLTVKGDCNSSADTEPRGGPSVESPAPELVSQDQRPDDPRVLTLAMMRPVMNKYLANKSFELIDANHDGSITREEFVAGMIKIYQQRKSLALTLKDYEAILRKLGYVITACALILLIFIVLWIFQQNVLTMGVSVVSFVVGFSFLIGPQAAAFFQSFIFIFVTKAYDVGDRVYFKDDIGVEQNYVVQHINMLTTVFMRWDDQYTVFANNLLAQKEIRNMRRSGSQVQTFTFTLNRFTPMNKIEGIIDEIKAYATANASFLKVIPESVNIGISSVSTTNQITAVFVMQQRSNWQDNSMRYKCQFAMLAKLMELLLQSGIDYSMPEQPVLYTSAPALPRLTGPLRTHAGSEGAWDAGADGGGM